MSGDSLLTVDQPKSEIYIATGKQVAGFYSASLRRCRISFSPRASTELWIKRAQQWYCGRTQAVGMRSTVCSFFQDYSRPGHKSGPAGMRLGLNGLETGDAGIRTRARFQPVHALVQARTR